MTFASRIRAIGATTGAVALAVAGLALATAPAAHAAGLDGCAVGTTVSFYEGETVTFSDTATCEVDSLSPVAGRVVDTFIPSPRGYSFLNTWPIAGDAIGTVTFLDSSLPGTPTVTVTLVSLGPSPTPIPDWLQAYGVVGPRVTCLGGWSNSWQAWAIPVTGGWVCTRTIPSLG